MGNNKIAFVSGAARGIGKGTAEELANHGVKVYVTDILDDEGMATAKAIQERGGQAEFIHLDTGNADQINTVIGQILDKEGRLDYAVNNAGIGGTLTAFHDTSKENWDRMMAINVSGVFYCMQAQLKAMLQQGSGSIVNVSSLAGLNGMAYGAPYSAAKHAVIGLSKSAASEYGKHNIRVNAICPGFTKTDIISTVPENILEFSTQHRVPLKRLGEVSEIAKSIRFLLSDDASFITGMTMNVGGGFQAA